jgi:uncharacterized repeat protein (TIGR02543 family)
MKKFSLKALSAFIFAAGLVVAGVAGPANAAALSPTATATGVIGTTGTNAYPITFTFTTVSTGADQAQIMLATGWTFVSEPGFGQCSWLTITGVTPSGCGGVNNGGVILQVSSGIPANTTITVVIPANTFNVGTGRNFGVLTTTSTPSFASVDTGNATLAGGSSSYSVSYNANGGSGVMANQSASTATTLNANTFTRSGYTFAGWNTAANGSGTSYANSANYAFTSSTTLYAQWTATLANTGINTATGISLLAGGLSLALVGAEMFMIARRKRSN